MFNPDVVLCTILIQGLYKAVKIEDASKLYQIDSRTLQNRTT